MEFDDNTYTSDPKKPQKSEAWEWTKAILIAVALVILIRMFIFKPFIVDGPSMQPNFHTGERLIVSEWIYYLRAPERGEVVVFHASAEKDYIKRVIGLPGEHISISNGTVYINGEPLDEPYIEEAKAQYKAINGVEYNDDFPDTLIPEGQVFVMGDNRVDSRDSRSAGLGTIEYSRIIGRADIVFWPMKKISIVNHNG